MKAIQDRELGPHTFPTNTQADLSPQLGGLQAGGDSRPVCRCITEAVPSVWSGAVSLESGSQTGAGFFLPQPVAI